MKLVRHLVLALLQTVELQVAAVEVELLEPYKNRSISVVAAQVG